MYFIYRISTIYNSADTLYIGSSKNWPQRKYQHLSDLSNPNSPRYNYPLYKHIRENNLSKSELVFEVLEESPAHNRIKTSSEQSYIQSYKPLFNQKAAKIEKY